MAWAWSVSAELTVYAGFDEAGVVARRAALFSSAPAVLRPDGRPVEPAPFPTWPPPDLSLVPVIEAAGAVPLVEGGVLRAEVLGLEVARVVDGILWVGVGRNDRRESAGELPSVVALVRRHRRHGVPSHPANLLARSRWLRSVLVGRPSLIGMAALAPLEPPAVSLSGSGLSGLAGSFAGPAFSGPAPALGAGAIVVASVGVDPDLVPAAADARLLHGSDLPLVLVVPEGDDHPVTRGLAAALRRPAMVVTVPRDWAARGP